MAFVDGSATAALELRNNVTPSLLVSQGATAGFNFVAFANLVRPIALISVVIIDSETIRVDFNGPIANEAATTVASNYEITTATQGAVEPTVKKVLLPDVGAPEFLIIEISEMTEGAAYEFAATGNVNGQNGVPVASDPVAFVGEGVEPSPELVVATSPTTARVEFTDQMKPTGDIGLPGSYTFSNGLVAEAVTKLDPFFVELRTTEQDPAILYTVTLTGVFLDGANNPMSSPFVTAMLGFQPFDVESRVLRLRIYKFITEIIRLEDQRRGGRFVERYLAGPQEVWDTIYNSILSLPILWDVEEIPDKFLVFLKNIAGWTRPLEPITNALDAATLRRLIAASVAFWKSRGPEDAIAAILRLTTGSRLRILNWFDFRWVSDETQLGWEWDGNDPWVVSDYSSQERDLVTLAGTNVLSDPVRISDMPIGPGDYDGLVVFVGVNSTDLTIQPPVFKSLGAERPMHPLGVVESASPNDVGRVRLTAWMLNGVDPGGGELDVTPVSMGSLGAGQPSVRVIAKTVKNLDRRRSILAFGNEFEGGAFAAISGGARSVQDLDTILASCLTTPLGAAPAAVAPMIDDAITLVDGGSTIMSTASFAGSRDGDEYTFEITGAASIGLTLAVALTGKESARELSGDEVVYQIRIVDDGTLDKALVRALASLTRPIGERVDILYLGFLDQFLTDDDNSQWTDVVGPGSVVEDGLFKLEDAAAELSIVSVPQATAWREYVVHTRIQITSETPAASQFAIVFYFQDIQNYYYAEFVLDSGADAITPSTSTVNIRKVIGGVDSMVETGTFPDMHRETFSTSTVEIVRDDNGNQNEIRIFIDENPVLQTTDPDLDNGTFGVSHVIGSLVVVDSVEMHFLPAETDFIGINNTSGALPSDAPVLPPGPGPGPTPKDCPVPTTLNKSMPALNTASEGDLATSQPVALDPVGHVSVDVNGLSVSVGSGTKSRACYFSDDGGTTAKLITNVAAGDLLYWNGTIAGYQLEAGWRIDFNYNVI